MVSLTLILFHVYIYFGGLNFFRVFDITYFYFIFLAPEITTTDGMSNATIISRFCIFWSSKFFFAFFCFSHFALKMILKCHYDENFGLSF